tara:strand:+ start:350 stop:745 length:396 start_codon:yes stop_codon:yes gene_type:complete
MHLSGDLSGEWKTLVLCPVPAVIYSNGQIKEHVMSIEETIKSKVAALNPQHLELINESHDHAGPATDSHFKLVLVSDEFDGKRVVARHQSVYKILADELAGPVHALALHLYTPAEWQDAEVPASPNCQGKH